MGATAKHVGVQQGAIAAQTSRRLPEQQAKTAEHPLLQLQRAFGNQAVQRGLSSGRFGSFVLQRKCASCEDEEQKKMQTKLAIRAPGDVYEQEADRVAEAVMSGGVQSSAVKPMAVSGGMQRCSCSAGAPQCDQCKAESAKGQPGFSEPAGSAAPPAVSEVLSAPGETLQRSARENMEERFGGHDFSGVRVHTDARAVESAQAVNALAYTVGNHVVFGAGQYAPSSRAGQHLLAHELTHVLQQRGSSGPSMQSKLAIGAANDPAEHEAELTATALADRPSLDAGPVQVTHTGPGLRRARYTTPQGANDVRVAHQNLPDKGKRYVMRYIAICPCRRVDDPQSGVFANPDLDDLVLVYRRCSGHHTWDYFGRLQSDASTALQTPSVPQGTLRGGVTGHITGTGTSGRVDVNVLGGNEVAGGQLGGQAAGVLEHKGWTFSLSAEYRRNLQPSPGTPSDQVLGQTALCPPGWPFCITASGTVGDPQLGTSVTGGIRSRTAPPISRDTCITCICPRRVAYSCWEDHPETLDTHDVDVETHPELRFYFAWNRSDQQSEEGYLRDASRRNFEQVATLLRTGHYSIVSIVGYASPEGAETVAGPTRSGFVGNQALSEARATATAERLRVFLHGQGLTNVAIPTPTTGGGELLGRRPRSEPSSQLKEIISDAGFHDAEELSIFLNGGEIGQRDLDPQFRGLLSDKRMTPDLQMELFGLEHNDPIRPQVTAAVSAFLATRPGTRSRPWEGIFRLFRYGAILMQGTETKSETTTTPAHSDTLEEGPCRDHGRELERTHEFGPMSPSALETQTRPRDEDAECAADEGGGSHEDCHYVPPPHQTDTLIAPDIAPERLDRP